MLALAALIFALADLQIAWETERRATYLVLDESERIASEERARVLDEFATLAREHPADRWATSEAVEPGLARESGSVLANRVLVAAATLPTDRARRIVVATDGREALAAARAIDAVRSNGIDVDVLPLGASPFVDEVSIRSVTIPRLVRAGERLDIEFALESAASVELELVASFDDRESARKTFAVRRGESSHRWLLSAPDDPGLHHFELRATGRAGIVPNDSWRSRIEVQPKPRVWIFRADDQPSALTRVLSDAGMAVQRVDISSEEPASLALDSASLVITEELDPSALSEALQAGLRRWVEEEGGGLITITGSNAVRRNPEVFRALEPISPPPALPEPRPLELVIVIDRSSSMSGSAMMAARSAATAAIQTLRPEGMVGAVAFSSAADRIHPTVPMAQVGSVLNFVRSIYADGGTNIAAAITAANRIMSRDPRYLHHVILISDGESEPRSAIAAAMALAGRGVSISTITIGAYSRLLAEIARVGRGRYHTTGTGGLRSIVVNEARYRQPPAQRQSSFRLRTAESLSMLDGLDWSNAPALGGYSLASIKDGATLVLAAPHDRPLLAHWFRGLGQVATFTSATSGGWANSFRSWPGFRALWTGLAKGMSRTRPVDPPQLRIDADPLVASRRIVTVAAPRVDSARVPIVRLLREGEPEPLGLDRVGPGVWQTSVPLESGFLVDARMPDDAEPTAAAAVDNPYPAALRAFGPDAEALQRLAALGGGHVLMRLSQVMETQAGSRVMQSLRTPLCALAIALYLLGLALLRWPERSPALAVPSAKRTVREPENERPPTDHEEAA